MTNLTFETKTSLKHKIKRFFGACLSPLIRFCFFSGVLYYIKSNSKNFLAQYFDLTLEKEKTKILSEQAQKASENLSFLSPSKISDYISSMTASAFAQAKVVSLDKTISLISTLLNATLWIIWFFLVISFITKCIEAFREKENQNEIANLVVEKLLPLLKTNKK